MIGRLSGTLLEKQPPLLLVDVGGVGYEVEAPLSTIYDLPAVGEPVTLLTHLVVKEDSHALYGFLEAADRTLFRNLLKVSGVGARLALTILSGADAAEFARLVASGDATALTRLPGIGKKTAERLVMEMRDRLGELPAAPAVAGVSAGGGAPAPADPLGEALAALASLGYRPQEAERMVRAVAEPGMSSEVLIREALRAQVNR